VLSEGWKSESHQDPPTAWRILVFVFIKLPLFLVIVGILLVVACNLWVNGSSALSITDDIDKVDPVPVTLVLGTASTLRGGKANLHFKYRIEAAAKLYHAGKTQHFLVSGDNATVGYNEPREMRRALVELGVPKEVVTCDFAGFRTLDSVVRAKKVFGQEKLLIVSDDFHTPRAVFIASHYDIDATGFTAQAVPEEISKKTRWRERFARVKVVLDLYFTRTKPKFLGEPVVISFPESPAEPKPEPRPEPKPEPSEPSAP
jgi:SanA protein